MNQKNARTLSISPRLEGYLTRANAILASREKTPTQHAAAQRVKAGIEGHMRQKQEAMAAAALSSRQPDPVIMMEKSEKK